MSRADRHWRSAFLNRFADRDDIGKENLYKRYFEAAGLPQKEVFECLELIEFEYEISAGLLRPEDKITKLFDRVATKNPLRWLVYRTREDDSASEVNYELTKRMHKYRTLGSWPKIETIDDLVRAWCGQAGG